MLKRIVVAHVFFWLLCSLHVVAQTTVTNNCPYALPPYADDRHKKDLVCLIPDLTKSGSTNLSNFNTSLAEVLSQLPLAVPFSGVGLTLDKSLGIYTVPEGTLGSVLTERGDTIGKHHLFVGFTFQKFTFQTVDGTSLNNLPSVFTSTDQVVSYGYSKNTLSANVNQYTGVIALGLTNRFDVSVIVPFERVSLSASNNYFQQTPALNQQPQSIAGLQAASGSASGFGDVTIEGKGTIWKGKDERTSVAAGLQARFPTGDQGLKALVEKPNGSPPPNNWRTGGYIARLPNDPWGNPYQFANPGLHGDIDVFSMGADAKPGGDGEGADIGSWNL